jgi:hypothetical protein
MIACYGALSGTNVEDKRSHEAFSRNISPARLFCDFRHVFLHRFLVVMLP